MSTYLESERLTLRPFVAADADLLIELDSDPAVMRYLTGGAPTPPEEVRDLAIPGILAGYERWDHDLGLFAAHEKDGGAFVGWFCLRHVMEKLGMTLAENIPTPDDMMAVEGAEHGGVRYEITKEQWEGRQASAV
ncbi:GNAT family N-acetyltransferase [Streptomyces gramineus]|uniref:GNAT family N-acetyltransferase n=1 Tax=Streptomyces gramineus TaxID=910542 RepID=UPI00398B20E6